MEDEAPKAPPRNGEGDRRAKPGGGGVFATCRKTIESAREERKSGNLPEILLWRILKTRPAGLKFRRQHPIGPYKLDFACLSARLAVEIDGEAHNRGDRPARDAERDAWTAARGFTTLRLPAALILRDAEAALTAILSACGQPLHQPSAGPPPRSGEVLEVTP